MKRHSLLSLLLFLLSIPASLTAQQIEGQFEVTLLSGDPVRPNLEVRVDVQETGIQEFTMKVSVSIDGGPWRESPQERATMWPVVDGVYYWVNERGSTGIVAWNEDTERWESTSLTGRFAGSERAWKPL